ncbi:ras-related protein Rab-3D-like [Oscarella lobularis]|uniref:ras-related protein Rab-3D-like n=1 Tax=Oscarella lobularis TaxID=121494 RepID=UPI003313CD68
MTDSESHFTFKICLVGDSHVGKTDLCKNYVERATDSSVFRYHKQIENENRLYTMEIYDLPGAHRHADMASHMCSGSAGLVYVFDKTRRQTLTRLDDIRERLKTLGNDAMTSVLVGNRRDSRRPEVVTYEDGRAYASKYGMTYFETNLSTERENAKQPFDFLFTEIEDRIPDPVHPSALVNQNIHIGPAFDTPEMRAKLFFSKK